MTHMHVDYARLFRVGWRNWFLLAGVSVLTTIGLASAIVPLAQARIPHLWPWANTDLVLLAGLSVATLAFALYLTVQQRQLEALRQQIVLLQREELEHARASAEVVARINAQLTREISERVMAQENLGKLNETLEQRVAERSEAAEKRAHELQDVSRSLEDRNRRLIELYRTAHQFVDNVSHEFRTPLTVIKEYTSALQEGCVGDISAEQHEYLGVILHRVEDLTVMVNDMLDISKIESDILRMVRKPSRLQDVFERVRTTLERKAAATHVTLELQDCSGLPTVFCDPEKVARVLVNLVVNALKFTDDGGLVQVSARHDEAESMVVVDVTDNGRGIAPENLEVIFERFKQVDQGSRSAAKGFGLGLNIVRELVHLNLGEISVESQVGYGSTFRFTLPVDDPAVLMRQYFRTMRLFRHAGNQVSLLTLSVPPDVAPEAQHEIHNVLMDQVRRGDVLFHPRSAEWLLVASVPDAGVPRLVARFEEVYAQAYYGPQRAPLPPLRIEAKGTFDVTRDAHTLIDLFKALYRRGTAPGA
jgi:signal transduction histidine kinase